MRPMTYSFKSSGRGNKDLLNEGMKDKDVNVAPNQYETEKYDATIVVDPKNKLVAVKIIALNSLLLFYQYSELVIAKTSC